ncbi:hypothetical protein TheetDRAFT_1677 [Thermoanaerobacter ethanolicus JW 200]|nr:hypothetical protein TheetDRAFT_1677 [Thermoanaerobacter ethanolicus JW 200]
MDGGGGHLKAWMPIVPGTLPEPEGRAFSFVALEHRSDDAKYLL